MWHTACGTTLADALGLTQILMAYQADAAPLWQFADRVMGVCRRTVVVMALVPK